MDHDLYEETIGFSFSAKVSFVVEDSFLVLSLAITSEWFDEVYQDSHRIPLDSFPLGSEQIKAFQVLVVSAVRQRITDAHLANELKALFADIINLSAAVSEMPPWQKKGVAAVARSVCKVHAGQTEQRLLELFEVKSRGRFRQWTTLQMIEAIDHATFVLEPDEAVTYDSVALVLRAIPDYADRAPKSGESLRKLLKALDVDWKPAPSGK